MPAVQETVDQVRRIDVDQYKYGFETQIESEKAPKGLSEDTVRFISAKKNEPEWMLAWRLDAYRRWLTMHEPKWAKVEYGPIDYQDIYYYSAPKEGAEVARRDRPGDSAHLREARHSAARARGAARHPASRRTKPAKKAKAARAATAIAASRSMRCSIPFRSPPPSRPSSPRPACCSCRSRKRCTSIPNW